MPDDGSTAWRWEQEQAVRARALRLKRERAKVASWERMKQAFAKARAALPPGGGDE